MHPSVWPALRPLSTLLSLRDDFSRLLQPVPHAAARVNSAKQQTCSHVTLMKRANASRGFQDKDAIPLLQQTRTTCKPGPCRLFPQLFHLAPSRITGFLAGPRGLWATSWPKVWSNLFLLPRTFFSPFFRHTSTSSGVSSSITSSGDPRGQITSSHCPQYLYFVDFTALVTTAT